MVVDAVVRSGETRSEDADPVSWLQSSSAPLVVVEVEVVVEALEVGRGTPVGGAKGGGCIVPALM